MNFDSCCFIGYIRKRNFMLMNKSEWESLFYHCYCNPICSGKADEGTKFKKLNLSQSKIKNFASNDYLYRDCSCSDNVDLSDFADYVVDTGLDIISKPEWQAAFFYFYVKQMILENNRGISSLSINEIYRVSDDLRIDYSKVNSLMKKAVLIEDLPLNSSNYEDITFIEFVKKFIPETSFQAKDGELAFEIINPLVLENYKRYLRVNHIYQDYSFNRNIVRISANTFVLLSGKVEKTGQDLESALNYFLDQNSLLIGLKTNELENFVKDCKNELQKKRKSFSVTNVLNYLWSHIAEPVGVGVLISMITVFLI